MKSESFKYVAQKQYSHLLHIAKEAFGYESQTEPIFQDKFDGRKHFEAGFSACWHMFSPNKYSLESIPPGVIDPTEKDVYGQTHDK